MNGVSITSGSGGSQGYVRTGMLAPMSFGKRLRAARRAKDKTQADIARLFGITREGVAQWESNQTMPESDKLDRLARYLSISTDELLSGKVLRQAITKYAKNNDVSDGPEINQRVPLISWVRAGKFDSAEDPFRPGEGEDWYPMPKKAGSRTYCLRVEGESMTAQHGRSYPDGSIIFVDPDQRSPVNGRRVIAKLDGSDGVTFKVLVQEAGKVFLKPLNQQYPAITEPFRIIGTVIGKWEDE